MGKVERFEFKLGGMRKADSFIVYPGQRHGGIMVQGNRTIAVVMPDGTGWLNWKGTNSKYGTHLSPFLGAEKVTFPKEFVWLAQQFQPVAGDTLGAGGTVRLA